MKEIEIAVPSGATRDGAESLLQRCFVTEDLAVSLKGTLRTSPGSIHWHLRRPGERGTLEATLWPDRRRVWLKVQPGRLAPWVEPAAERLKARIEKELAQAVTRIVIEEYNPEWPAHYAREEALITRAIGDWAAAVEHIGSTSVPGLRAKPIIDIMVGLRSLEDAVHCIEPLAEVGYEYRPDMEVYLPDRRYFRKGPGGSIAHLHMVERGSRLWVKDLTFRDYLRGNPEAVREYGELKRKLVESLAHDVFSYTLAKSDFIMSAIGSAGVDVDSLGDGPWRKE